MSSPETDPKMLHAFASDADGPDASARVLRERHLGRATLLAAVEELARSIAHDINQPLGALLMTAKACRRGWENGSLSQEQIQQALERIAADAQRATEILAPCRTATRRQGVVLAPTDVNAAIQQALAVTGDELALLGIAPMVNLSLNLPPARANRSGLEQAILRLIAHACEAVTTVPRCSPFDCHPFVDGRNG
jgi:phosphoglycerate-specific signal transduction histidine kinase